MHMKLSLINPNLLTSSIVEKVLFLIPHDNLKKGDCIFVFGSKNDLKNRMDKAIQLYQCGRASKILLSGGYGQNGEEKEALLMKKYALQGGVLEQDIFIEDQSNNTTENVLCSLLVLHRLKILPKIKRMLIVTSPIHMKRCMLTLSRYMPRWISYSYCYYEDSIYSQHNWIKYENLKRKLFEEVSNMIMYAREGIIDDIDIKI